ncbi:MAG: hypothetical protein ACI976_001624 [Aureispira sp.]|jgi:hypothetical protein
MKISLLSLFFLSYSTLWAQNVSTFFNSASGQRIDDALLLDAQGNIYGSHYQGANVYKVTPSGVVNAVLTGLNTPNGLAFDSQGNLYVCDNIGNRVYKYSPTFVPLDTLVLSSPSGIIKAMNSDTMIVTTYAGHQLLKLAPNGSLTPFHAGAPLNGPVGMAYDENGQLYVGNFSDRKIYKVFEDSLAYVATIPGGSNLGFITYTQGAIWGATINQHKIYKVIPSAIDSVILYSGLVKGAVDGSISQAIFDQSNGIVATPSGDTIYISDFGAGRIRIITGITLDNYLIPEAQKITLVYPNPTKSKATVLIEKKFSSIHLKVVNTMGQTMLAKLEVEGTHYTFDLTNLATGAYYILITIDGQTEAVPVVRE